MLRRAGILIQGMLNVSLAKLLNRAAGEKYSMACPLALIGASNFLKLVN
jgi:ACR3 family arsenite transporter